MKEKIESESKKEEIASESKKKTIESMLDKGIKPEEVADEVGCSLRYVYVVKSGMGLTEKQPTMKNNVAEIKGTLKDICKDVRALARTEAGFFIVCPVEDCSALFNSLNGEVCGDCGVAFCSSKCIEEHKEEEMFGGSKCQEYQEITSQVKEGDDNE